MKRNNFFYDNYSYLEINFNNEGLQKKNPNTLFIPFYHMFVRDVHTSIKPFFLTMWVNRYLCNIWYISAHFLFPFQGDLWYGKRERIPGISGTEADDTSREERVTKGPSPVYVFLSLYHKPSVGGGLTEDLPI